MGAVLKIFFCKRGSNTERPLYIFAHEGTMINLEKGLAGGNCYCMLLLKAQVQSGQPGGDGNERQQ